MKAVAWFFRNLEDGEAFLNKRPGNDAGYDVYAMTDKWFWPFQTKKIETNGRVHIPAGNFGRITSRSGHALRGWLTHAGTVDRGYTGIIGVTQTNLSLLPRRIRKGERIAQIIFIPFTEVEMKEIRDYHEFAYVVGADTHSDRGEQAYNSSGR